MPLDWIDVRDVPFLALLLLERVQITWLPGWPAMEPAMSVALAANPSVAWYMTHKCPEVADWVREETRQGERLLRENNPSAQQVRQAERDVLANLVDLLVYALDPAIYDAQPFTGWDTRELTGLVDFRGKTVIDVGAGTGKLAFTAAPLAKTVFAVEPVGSLRDYMRARAGQMGLTNFYAVDGLITRIPFPQDFADVVMAGHVLGDDPPAECAEMLRVTRPGGMLIFCPGCNETDPALMDFMTAQGFQHSLFEEPQEGMKVKFWKVKA
jgi:SAM-dependent methyltransferase